MNRIELYSSVAQAAASTVIRRYSTSFGLASTLLSREVRAQVESIYALVRIADEIVDGAVVEAGLDVADADRFLTELELDTEQAMVSGYSVNPIVHAFARTARSAGFGSELTAPFFSSMRSDLNATEHDQASFNAYVYGSAEVVGLMCVAAFVAHDPVQPPRMRAITEGAQRLGAAFQKVNFLRDLSADFEHLGRSYFPGINVLTFGEVDKTRLLDDIDADLAVSARAVRLLPRSSRRAVALAQALFTELAERIRATPAEELMRTRVRVPAARKAAIAASAALGKLPPHPSDQKGSS